MSYLKKKKKLIIRLIAVLLLAVAGSWVMIWGLMQGWTGAVLLALPLCGLSWPVGQLIWVIIQERKDPS